MGLLDQSIVSAGNFTAVWVLARKLDVADYGLYVMIIGLILALNSIQSALVAFPFTVRYAGAEMIAWQAGLIRCLIVSLATMAIQIPAIVIGCRYLGHLFIAVPAILALCLWQTQDFIRRAMFQQRLYRQALTADSIRYVIPALLVILLPRRLLSAQQMLIFIATTSAAASLVCANVFIRREAEPVMWIAVKRDFSELWRIGRSIILFNASASALAQGCVWILGNVVGLSAASQYQAINNVMGVTNPAVMGIAVVRDPAVARESSQSGPRAAIRHSFPYAAAVGLLVLPVMGLFIAAPAWTLLRFYGKASPYISLAVPLQIAAVAQVLTISSQFVAAVIALVGRATVIWRVQIATNAACLAFMIPVIQKGGLSGCLLALAFFYAVGLVAMFWNLGKIYREGGDRRGSNQTVVVNA